MKNSTSSYIVEKLSYSIMGDNGNFDVLIGSFDGAEVCELAELYLLNQMTSGKNPIFNPAQVGLYHNDCLAVISGSVGVIEDHVFREEGLEIVAAPSTITTDFLDVEVNLSTREYKPYRKPNDNPIYINAKFNHPNIIIILMIEHKDD